MPAALRSNPALLVSAFLRIARAQVTPMVWVTSLQMAALIGDKQGINAIAQTMQGSFAIQYSEEGGMGQFIRELPPNIIAELCESALQTLEAEVAAAACGLTGTGPGGSVRGFDFSQRPCTLG